MRDLKSGRLLAPVRREADALAFRVLPERRENFRGLDRSACPSPILYRLLAPSMKNGESPAALPLDGGQAPRFSLVCRRGGHTDVIKVIHRILRANKSQPRHTLESLVVCVVEGSLQSSLRPVGTTRVCLRGSEWVKRQSPYFSHSPPDVLRAGESNISNASSPPSRSESRLRKFPTCSMPL